MHSTVGEHPLTQGQGSLSDDSSSDELVFAARPNTSCRRYHACKHTDHVITGLDLNAFADHLVDDLRNGLRECESWLTDWLVPSYPHRRVELCSRVRSSSSKLRRSAAWIHALLSSPWMICEFELLTDTPFTENYSWITSCIMLLG